MLYQLIGQQVFSNVLCPGPVKIPADEILARGIDLFINAGGSGEQQRQRLPCGPPHVVSDTGPEAYLDEPVKLLCQRPVNQVFLNDGIGKRPCSQCRKLFAAEIHVHGIDFNSAHRCYRHVEVILNPLAHFFSQRIPDIRFKSYFNTVCHRFYFL